MQEVLTRALESGGKVQVRSALNPILWLCGLISLPALTAIGFGKEFPNFVLFTVFSPVFVAIFGFLYLLVFDRDKLQTEDYQIKKKSLEIIEQSDGNRTITLPPSESVENPELLERGNGE